MQTAALATRPRLADGALPGGYRHIGAPTIYKPEYAQAIIDYFEAAQLPGDLAPNDSGSGSGRRALERVYTHMPTLQGFARSIGTHTQRIYEWAARHPSFADACARARCIMDQHLAQGLASGVYNPTGAIFVAKNLAGWKDRTEVETVSRVEDSESTIAMKRALEHATPSQLADLSALVQQMLANTPASIE
jgi:DNA-packaging protein gp3